MLHHPKHAVALVAAPLLRGVLRWTRRQAGLVLLYHGISEADGDHRRELVPPLGRTTLRRQLNHLRRHYEVVELHDLARAVSARRRGGRFPVAITFDDDLPQHATHALPELLAAGVSATFFLSGSFLHAESQGFWWWQHLQRAADSGFDLATVRALLPDQPEDPSIHGLAAAIQELPPDRRDEVGMALKALVGSPPEHELLSVSLAEQLVGAGGSVGFHTRRHDPLPQLNDAQLSRALSDGREALELFARQRIDTLAYPHGAVDARVATAAAHAGFTIGVTSRPAAVTPQTEPLLMGRCVPRPGWSPREFALELVRPLLAVRDTA